MAVLVGEAQAAELGQRFQVCVVRGLTLGSLEEVARLHVAVGLLVPGAGPETSERAAIAMLERGVVRNSLRDPVPSGPALIDVRFAEPGRDGDLPPCGSARRGHAEPAIVLGVPRGGEQPNDRRYPVVVIGRGYRGLLTSDSTRIPGLVSIDDIAPTALGRDDSLGSQPSADALGKLRTLDRRIHDNNEWRSRTASWLEATVAALAVVSGIAAVLGVGALLLANLVLGAVDVPPVLAFAVLLAAALAGLPVARLVRRRVAVAALLAAVPALCLFSFLVDERWVALSPLGPTQNARFYGITNLLETLLLVPVLAAAALLRRPIAFALVAALAFVTIAGSRFGADGGGAVVLGVGFAVLGALLAGAGRRAAAAASGAGIALVLALVAVDALTGASSHVTRALHGGPGGLARDLADRVELSWERATAEASTAITIAVALGVFVLLALRLLRARVPARTAALPVAFLAAIATSLVVNDSPKDVTLAGLAGYLAVESLALGSRSAAGGVGRRLRARRS
ncbi:MAG: hypothetical protein ABR583_01375 [Gaiellaceae bacterium]